jgi:hypothetical protein
MTEPPQEVPALLDERIGMVFDGDETWGYLHVFPSWVDWPVGLKARRRDPCLVEEIFRILRPSPDAVDFADGLGLSDSIIVGDAMADEVAHLNRDEFTYVGRVLRIEWADDATAEQIRKQYFADSRW